MNDIIPAHYQSLLVSFSEDAWFNATQAAAYYGKRPNDWLLLDETQGYIAVFLDLANTGLAGISPNDRVNQNHFVKTRRGKNGGTWLHPSLAVAFARWLDVRFAIWCDLQIRKIIAGNHPHFDWKRLRHEASASGKVVNEALRIVREARGKATATHHYMNECRLINSVLTGEFKGIDRDTLSHDDLTLLARLEVKDAVLLGLGFSFQERQTALRVHAVELRQPRNPALSVQPPLVKVFHDSHHGASALQ